MLNLTSPTLACHDSPSGPTTPADVMMKVSTLNAPMLETGAVKEILLALTLLDDPSLA